MQRLPAYPLYCTRSSLGEGPGTAFDPLNSTRTRACDILLRVVHEEKRPLAVKKIKHKVFAYITHGHHLLVFRHLYVPEAGIQVPAGTVETHERSDDAVLREASEEIGRAHV